MSPQTLLSVLSVLLQEKTLLLHSTNRAVAYNLVNLVLSLMTPLVWPYPIVPVLPSLQDTFLLLDSPIPVLCCIEGPLDQFEIHAKRWSLQFPSAYIVQIDRGWRVGTLPVDLLPDIIEPQSFGAYHRLLKLHDDLDREAEESLSDRIYEEVATESKYSQLLFKTVQYYQRVMHSVYFQPLSTILDRDEKTAAQVVEQLMTVSKYNQHVNKAFFTGQILVNYLEQR